MNLRTSKNQSTKTQSVAGNVAQRKPNNTGLPDNLKSGIENLSGHSMDDVKVHYNSSRPAQLQAHAFAQGNQIHLASGQEKHLPHEAWHVVQQKQGRVKPTMQLKSSVPVNDDPGLEKEADVMGEKALQLKAVCSNLCKTRPISSPMVQRVDWEWWGGAAKAVAGTTAGIIGGTAGAVTGAAKGVWNEGLSTKALGHISEGAKEGYEHPATAVGTLAGGAIAATALAATAAPLTVTTAALSGGAVIAGAVAGSKVDKASMEHIPAKKRNPNFNGDVQHDILASLYAHDSTDPKVPAAQKANILERSDAEIFWYGKSARTDERVEVTASASYLHKQNRAWASELRTRQLALGVHKVTGKNVRSPQKMSWEKFQDGVGQIHHGYPHNPPAPWFMDHATGGYDLHQHHNVQALADIAQGRRDAIAGGKGTAQERFGATYQHDVGAYALHHWAAADNYQIYVNSHDNRFPVGHVLILSGVGNRKTSIKIEHLYTDKAGFHIRGRVLKSPHHFINIADGATIDIWSNTHQAFATAGGHTINITLNGRVVSEKYYQVAVAPTELLGIAVPGNDAKKRNRGPQVPLDDHTFTTLQNRMTGAHSLSTALGPYRGADTWDGKQLGLDVKIADYRRLGGDIVFQEAQHPHPLAYHHEIQSPQNVDMRDANWYHESQRSMQGRFVGGRSNSTLGYMTTGTLLYHEHLLSMNEAKDILAFAVADMVVSGEHSMPECITTVIHAGAGMDPWKNSGIHTAGVQQAIYVWLKLVDAGSKRSMKSKTRQLLVKALREKRWNYELIRILNTLNKVLHNAG
ncbi:MAG: DUF4157 domain-containing protein [Cyclobacteriaceae bacterium]